jgi:hypothetical protein
VHGKKLLIELKQVAKFQRDSMKDWIDLQILEMAVFFKFYYLLKILKYKNCQ